jgi:3-methyladenine DNA glycosylase/8-oxoguanine DNA glycosylase
MARCTLPVEAPFSLAITVMVLRRLPSNIVDRWDDGTYTRVLDVGLVGVDPYVVRVRQLDATTLEVSADGKPEEAIPSLRSLLGLEVEPTRLERAVRAEPRLVSVYERVPGLRPPRYPSLFEAIGMTIPFQQVSLAAGQSIANRVVERFGRSRGDGWLFPVPEAIAAATLDDLRACGLSESKARTLITAAEMLLDGRLVEADLLGLPSSELVQTLDAVPGIGPWTAGVIALRGLGRLDVFPRGDVGARRLLADLLGQPAPLTDSEETALLARLGDTRGFVYFLALAASRLS